MVKVTLDCRIYLIMAYATFFVLFFIYCYTNKHVACNNLVDHDIYDYTNNEIKLSTTKNSILRRLYAPLHDYEAESNSDCGEPLFLTPLLQKGKVKEARNLSRVVLPDDPQATHSFSGYFTVDPNYESNMFFWFFPAKQQPEKAPILIWLQGGPGGSSLFGLFAENGPFNVDKNLKLVYRNYSWTDQHNVLYFDNPVGTGFSFTKEGGYCCDESCVGVALYNATLQFLQLFPELQRNDLYVTGESYAGKYVPALSYTIHKENPTASQKINLKGMAIGDGLCDPATMTDYGDFLYGVGLLDEVQRDVFRKRQDIILQDIEHQLWRKAFQGFDELLNSDTLSVPSLFTNMTGLTFYYNYLVEAEPKEMGYYMYYINQADVRRAIHVGNLTFNDGKAVEQNLITDVMQSVKPWIEELLNHRQYRVMVYNGQLDVIVAYSLTRNFIESMDWQDAELYRTAPRHVWKVGSDVAGYVKETPNFAEVLIRGAGHMVPYDQPSRAYHMINRFTSEAGAGKLFS